MHRDSNCFAQLNGGAPTAEIIERDDGYVATTVPSPEVTFRNNEQWPVQEQCAVQYAEAGCSTLAAAPDGTRSIFTEQGCDVTGIDASHGAIKVCKSRGLKKALIRPISDIDKFGRAAFDSIVMLGNNFGLFGSRRKHKAAT
jgi:hypothetical protein